MDMFGGCQSGSSRRMGEKVEIPDFTRGAWAKTKPLSIGGIDLKKMNFKFDSIKKDDSQLSV